MVIMEQERIVDNAVGSQDPYSPFTHCSGQRINHHLSRRVQLSNGEQATNVNVTYNGDDSYMIDINGDEFLVEGVMQNTGDKNILVCSINGVQSKANVILNGDSLHVFTAEGGHELKLPAPKFVTASGKGDSTDGAVAPMPGVVEKVHVEPGQSVDKGDPLVVMIAMKMEYVIRAPKAGVIKGVPFKAGDTVNKGKSLVSFEEE